MTDDKYKLILEEVRQRIDAIINLMSKEPTDSYIDAGKLFAYKDIRSLIIDLVSKHSPTLEDLCRKLVTLWDADGYSKNYNETMLSVRAIRDHLAKLDKEQGE